MDGTFKNANRLTFLVKLATLRAIFKKAGLYVGNVNVDSALFMFM